MALEYDTNNKFEALAPVLEDYANWFSRIAVHVAYPEEQDGADGIVTPGSFKEWLESTKDNEDFSQAVVDDLTKIHDDMLRAGVSVVESIKGKTRPAHQDFVDFKNLYTAFLSRIRRVEKDSALEGSGMDDTTGLRSAEVLQADLKKEMERLSRQGNPFSIVMARIDRFAGHDNQSGSLDLAVASIKDCMRSFDDAYYMGLGQFLISLKHADIIGAQAAVNRLQQSLKKNDDNTDKITMSYCMAEPIPGDGLDEMINNMKQDLNDHLNDRDAVLKFLEMSPLERFVNAMD